jgi:DNA-binding NtrC family response regulator
MRIKILLVGEDPLSLLTDGQLLKERGILVYTAFYLENMEELIREIKPDLVFFNPHKPSGQLTNVYNDFVNSIYFTHIPVVYTLSEDDVYLVTRKRTTSKDKRTIISDNIVDAVKMALRNNKTASKKTIPIPQQIVVPVINARA